MSGLVPVTALPRIVSSLDRQQLAVPEGATVAEIVGLALPDLPDARRGWVRVIAGDRLIPEAEWAEMQPAAGVPVVVHLVPAGGGDALRSVLSIVVTVAALALGQIWAVPLAGALGVSSAVAGGIITGATMFAGMLLVNALVPPAKADTSRTRTYSIDSTRNSIAPDAPVPLVLGTIRWAPPYAALPWTEEVGDELWWTAAFVLGYGPLEISDLRIGDTPISHYSDVQMEIRQGFSTDQPLSLYSTQVHEENISVELSHDAGPVTRVSGGDAAEIGVQLTFPGGLFRTDKKGRRNSLGVAIRIRQRLAGSSTWETVIETTIDRKATSMFRWGHRWTPATRGRYEIECFRVTDDRDEDDTVSDIVTWTALRTFRPEYPFNVPASRPLALIAIRMRASKQLQGALEELTVLTSSIGPDWDAASGTWIDRATRSPAAHCRRLLQGAQIAYPFTDDELDLGELADWAEHCAAKGLAYDAVLTDEQVLADTLREVCQIGRARPDDRGSVWGVVVDKPVALITTAITERNASAIRVERQYTRYPDGVRVKFKDRDNLYREATRVVPWIGFTGTPTLTEEWEAPGITDAAQVWTWARRRMRELALRPDTYTASQGMEHLVVGIGSRVALASRILKGDMQIAQLIRAEGTLLWLDSDVTLSPGTDYRVRIRAADGSTQLLSVVAVSAETTTALIRTTEAPSPVPERGDLVMLGPYGDESVDAIVTAIEPGDDLTAILTLKAHAPEIDTLTDADIPPAWDGRAGGEVASDSRVPLAPRISEIESGWERSGDPDEICVRLLPGLDDPVAVSRYDLRHRAAGGSWTTLAGQTSIIIWQGYSAGAHIQISARATSAAGVTGPWCDPIDHTVRAYSAPGPDVSGLTITRQADGSSRIAWDVADAAAYTDQASVRLRWRAGTAPVGASWGWDDLSALHAGLLLSSPYTTSALPDGAVTLGVRAQDAAGAQGEPLIGAFDVLPLPPRAITATAEGGDIRVAVTLRADLTASGVRVWRSLQSAEAWVDVSGLLDAAPSARVVWLDTDPGPGPWRYRATAETADAVQSLPSAEATP